MGGIEKLPRLAFSHIFWAKNGSQFLVKMWMIVIFVLHDTYIPLLPPNSKKYARRPILQDTRDVYMHPTNTILSGKYGDREGCEKRVPYVLFHRNALEMACNTVMWWKMSLEVILHSWQWPSSHSDLAPYGPPEKFPLQTWKTETCTTHTTQLLKLNIKV